MDTDTLIIGAGPAGLAAAHLLARHDHRLTVLEARARIGGRAFTLHAPTLPAPIELGAEFIHGLPPEILEPARARAIPFVDGSFNAFHFDGAELKPADADERLSAALDRIRRYEGPDVPYDDFAAQHLRDLPAGARAFVRQYVEGFNAADASRVGLHSLKVNEQASEQIDGERLARFVHGYGPFLAHLLTPAFPLHLSTPVHTVEWQPGRVKAYARAADGSILMFTARRAIVTVPLALLQQRAVVFVPEPADILQAADRLAAGQAVKLLLHFREPFWEPLDGARYRDLAFLYAPDEPFPTWWTQLPLRAPLLTAWAGGAQTAGLLHRSPAELLSLALHTLSKIFRQDRERLAAILQACHHHDWHADPHARAAYSWVPVGASDAPRLLTRPVESTLFFAGEHTHDQGEIGTLNGALYTGHRAARQVLASFRPNP